MHTRFFLVVTLWLAMPLIASGNADAIPGAANWYFHADLKSMRSSGPGATVYDWLRSEVLDEMKEDAGIDFDKEVDRITSYSVASDNAVLIVEGKLSQQTRDIIMAFIATGGDIEPRKSGGKRYFHFTGDDEISDDLSYEAGDVVVDIDTLGDKSYISMAVKNKVIVTSTEAHMHTLLANNGRVAGERGSKRTLLVLTAEKSFLQGGMKAAAIDDDDWDSNILRNTEQAAFLVSAAADKLAIDATLVTTEAEMAESLASVVRGLISLVSFNDEMSAALIDTLRGTKVKTKGNSLSISLAVDPDVVVETFRD